MSMRPLAPCVLAGAACLLLHPCALAFNANAHQHLTAQAINVSAINMILEKNFSTFPAGIETPIDGTPVAVFIEQGSVNEDTPDMRALNHFHDPTETWDVSGFHLGPVIGQSSIAWSQNSDQSPGGMFSWYDARTAYYQALVGDTQMIRNAACR